MTREEYERLQGQFIVDMAILAETRAESDLLRRLALAAVIDRFGPYLGGVAPESYRCASCGQGGCKLWRQPQMCADQVSLQCATCCDADVDSDGRASSPYGRTDQIAGLVPAVPTEDGTFWGYSSVPTSAVAWWRGLPSYPEAKR